MIYVIAAILVYLAMMGFTVWLGGKIGYMNDGEVVAGFCFVWPVMLIIVLFVWLYRTAENQVDKEPKEWESRR